MPMYRGDGLSNHWSKVLKENRGTKNIITEKYQAYETKTNKNIGIIAGRFYVVFQMKKTREISNFQEYQTKFLGQYSLKLTQRHLFSFWVNNIFTTEQTLFDICRVMQYQKSSYRSV